MFFKDSFDGLATLLTALVAIGLFYWEQIKKKRDAAKIVVQEIRRAEDVINEYKEHGEYRFTKKIIATNSWARNIHYFVGNLEQDEIDKVSNLYSIGVYSDSIIEKVSDQNFEDGVKVFKEQIKQIASGLQNAMPNGQSTASGNQSSEPSNVIANKIIPIKINIPPPWKMLLDEISYKYEPIYHSEICIKLKRIAGFK